MSVRAFEVVPVIEKLVEGKSKTKITAVESYGDSLYVGTTDGFLVYYELDQGTTATGKLTCSTTLKAQGLALTGSSKPVSKIMLAPDEGKVLVLVDSRLVTLHAKTLKPVEGSKIVKGHGIICRDSGQDGSPTCHFSVTKKAKIPGNFGGFGGLGGSLVGGIYHYAFDKSTGVLGADQRMRDNEGGNFTDCVAIARDGRSVCFARKGMYKVINLMTQEVTELFPYDDQHTIPMVTRVGSREFLLNVWTEGVTTGMFVSSTGNISRAPIQWPFGPTAIAVNYPYIVALNQEQGMVTVHSILDQQSKQVLVYPDGLILNDTSQRIFIATGNKISLIANLSFETQIDELLLAGRVAEALELAQVTFTPDGALDATELNKQQQAMQRIQRRAGLAYLQAGQFGDGLDLLAATDTDPREVIAMYPNLLPASSSYKPGLVQQTTEAAASIAAVTKSDADLAAAKKALVNFLNVIRSDNVTSEWRSDIDTVLARLYAELDGSMLLELVSMDEHASNSVNVEEVEEVLAANNRHHALALLQWGKAGSPRKALEIWRGLTTKKLVDDAYPGLEFAIKALSGISDADLVYMHAEWMLNADETAGRVFTQRSNKEEPAAFLKPDDVMAFLRPYAAASLDYLEYLVFEVQNTSEPYHTRLALLYLERVKAAMAAYDRNTVGGSGDDAVALEIAVVTARSKLKILLQTSSNYKVEMLLAEVQRTQLHQECAVLYGKLGQHEQALKLLVNQLGDFTGAEEYCVTMSQSESSSHSESSGREGRQAIFLTLLRVYLVRGSGHSQQAIDLLNSPQTDLDPSKVLQMVPAEWGIGVLHAFLRRSVRQKMHLQRTSRITYGLAKQEHLQARAELLRLKGWGVVVTDDTPCEGAACIGKKTGTCSSFEGGGAVCINTETRQVAHKRCIKDEFRSAFPKASEKRPPTLLTYAGYPPPQQNAPTGAPPPQTHAPPPQVRVLSFKTHNNTYVSARNHQEGFRIVQAAAPQQLETFTSIPNPVNPKQVSLRTAHNKFVSVQPAGTLDGTLDAPNASSFFQLLPMGPGRVAVINAAHGTYLSAQPDGSMVCNRKAVTALETFAIV